MKNYFIIFCQFFAYITSFLLVRSLLRFKLEDHIVLPKGPIIIAANHPSRLDPFLICLILPPRLAFRLMPARFVTAEIYLRHWYEKTVMFPLGCVSTKQKGNRLLEMLEKLLKRGETIFFFPSGKRETPADSHKPKIGAIYLERNVPNAFILPINITIQGSLTLKNVFFRKAQIFVTLLEPYRNRDFPVDMQPLADNLMERIRKVEN